MHTGLFYVPANEWSMDIWNEPVAYKKGAAYLGAGSTNKADCMTTISACCARWTPSHRQDRLGK
jgi:hypothetical protein